MFQVGQTVIVRLTGQPVEVEKVFVWDGKMRYMCRRPGTSDSQSYREGDLVVSMSAARTH